MQTKHYIKAQLRAKMKERDRQVKTVDALRVKRDTIVAETDKEIGERNKVIAALNAEIRGHQAELPAELPVDQEIRSDEA